MKFNRALALGSAIFMSASALAASKGSNQRWFEMEVILFSQLSDKALLKEHFPDSQPLPKYKKVVDLLTPYINPDISDLKHQLAACGEKQQQQDLVSQAIIDNRQMLFNPKTLEQIQLNDFPPGHTLSGEFSDPAFATAQSGENELNASNNLPQPSLFSSPEAINSEAQLREVSEGEAELSPGLSTELSTEQSTELSSEQRELVDLAEQAFSPIQFSYSPQAAPEIFCRLDEALFKQYQQGNGEYSLDGFTITQMPLRIDGIEDKYASKPYLLSRDSLKLRSIVTQLRRSKNFKPLLHLGWRQPTVSRRRAVPLRIFAGDNLQAYYQEAHKSYLQDMAASREQEQVLAQTLSGQLPKEVQMPETDATQVFEQRLNLQIQDILAQIETLDEGDSDFNNQDIARKNTATAALSDTRLINELNNPPIALEQNIEAFSEQLMLANAPEPPVQPWFLDGFFKVHVNHYLYITADFNIMDMTLAQQATQTLAAQGHDVQETQFPKAINFKQNRRVISGEIHYFDHPYMGMIVQIRRYKRPKPPAAQDNE